MNEKMKEIIQNADLPLGYQDLCKAAVNRSCWVVLHQEFFEFRCADQSYDCFHLVAGKPVSREVAEDPLTETEIKVFENRRLWRLVKAD